MATPADVLAAALVAAGVVVVPPGTPWPIYVGTLPIAPDSAVSIMDAAGREDGRDMVTGAKLIHPGVQIRIRAQQFADAEEQGLAIIAAIDPMASVVVSETGEGLDYIIRAVTRTTALVYAGTEQRNRRQIFFMNCIMTIDSASAIPAGALLDENGVPVLDENGNYIIGG